MTDKDMVTERILQTLKTQEGNFQLIIDLLRIQQVRLEKLEKDSTTGQGWVKWLANQIGV